MRYLLIPLVVIELWRSRRAYRLPVEEVQAVAAQVFALAPRQRLTPD